MRLFDLGNKVIELSKSEELGYIVDKDKTLFFSETRISQVFEFVHTSCVYYLQLVIAFSPIQVRLFPFKLLGVSTTDSLLIISRIACKLNLSRVKIFNGT